MFYLLFFIVIVAALCILSAQITFVVQKTREIGMLKALGATNLQISGIFLSQSAIIGVLGVLAGYGLGILALAYRNEFLHFMNRLTGCELFPASHLRLQRTAGDHRRRATSPSFAAVRLSSAFWAACCRPGAPAG